VSEWEKTNLVRKLAASRERIRKRTGKCEGPPPYGAKPGEAPILRYILARRHEVKLHGDLARELNENGYKTRDGSPWTRDRVRGVLRHHKPAWTGLEPTTEPTSVAEYFTPPEELEIAAHGWSAAPHKP
jgi:hypothetical protein